ncbi:MAG: amidohydrolase family protein, partial [Clostridiales Family XIII bacterium]|nr:amidohydrolase family protein [Clostridiales Family XIII bacterium]
GLVCKWADRIAVVEDGRIVETGPAREIIRQPQNAYTRTLVEADRLLSDTVLTDTTEGNRSFDTGAEHRVVLAATGLVKNFGAFRALDGVSIEVHAGECIGVVGESGSGKTTLARCLVGLERPDEGRIEYFGKGMPQIVFQDPYSSLNPAHTVRAILTEALLAGRTGRAGRSGSVIGKTVTDGTGVTSDTNDTNGVFGTDGESSMQATLTIEELLQLAELPAELLDRKPARLSGGQRQRVAIARALAPDPEVLILDESVSALDVVVQNQILGTIDRLRRERGLAILLITHDLSVVRMVASRVYVMNEARVVESGDTAQLFAAPKDPYTAKLLAAAAYTDIPRDDERVEDIPHESNSNADKQDDDKPCEKGVSFVIEGQEAAMNTNRTANSPKTGAYFGEKGASFVAEGPEVAENTNRTANSPKTGVYFGEKGVPFVIEGQEAAMNTNRTANSPKTGVQFGEKASLFATGDPNQASSANKTANSPKTGVQFGEKASLFAMEGPKPASGANETANSPKTGVQFGEKGVSFELEGSNQTSGANETANSPKVDGGDVTLYHNARIYTVAGSDWERHATESMAVYADGGIFAVGAEAEVRRAAEAGGNSIIEEIDLGGLVVLPGLVDSHVHAPGSAFTERFEIYLYAERSLAGTLRVIGEFVEGNPEREAYFGTGYYMSIFSGVSEAPCVLLDRIEGGKPFFLESSDGHSLWLNTAALELCGIGAETEAPIGGKIHIDPGTGEPSGILTDAHALVNRKPRYTFAQEVEAARLYQQKQLGWGHTAALHIAPHFGDPRAVAAVAAAGDWKMRVNLCALAEPDRPISETLEEARGYEEMFAPYGERFLTTTVKFFEDGVVEGLTAYLNEPYEEAAAGRPDYRSEPIWEQAQLKESFKEVTAAGFQIVVHSIGDAATRETLLALKAAREETAGAPEHAGGVAARRWTARDVITHLHVVGEAEIGLLKELGVIASYQPFWHFKEPFWYEEIERGHLGEQRAMAAYPVRTILNRGIPVTFSGDYPASPVNDPFWAIETAVTRNLANPEPYGVEDISSMDDELWLRNPGERITVKEAVEAYTIAGARQLFREDEIGSLEAGKQADFIVIDQDIFAVDPIRIDSTKVLAVYIAGEKVLG